MITSYKIFEHRNDSLMRHYLKMMEQKINKQLTKYKYIWREWTSVHDGSVTYSTNTEVFTEKEEPFTEQQVKIFKDYLKKFSEPFLDKNIMMSFQLSRNKLIPPNSKDQLLEIKSLYLCIFLKTLLFKRIVPDEFVYHSSDISNRENILKRGLIPKSSDESKEWSEIPSLAYPSVIFATNGNDTRSKELWSGDDKDHWQINTKGLSNIWWVDLNIHEKTHWESIMTKSPIPPDHIKLYKKSREEIE